MGPWLMPLLSVGASLLGSVFQNRQADRNAAAANEAAANPIKLAPAGMDLAMLRADAVKNGFNPLTILGATGGAPYASSYVGRAVSQPVSPLSAAFQAVGGIAEQKMQFQMQQVLNAAEFAQQEKMALAARSAEAALFSRQAFAGPAIPVEQDTVISVFGPNGAKYYLYGDQAARAGVSAGDHLTSGEMEQLGGQIWGLAAGAFGGLAGSNFQGMTGAPMPPGLPPMGTVTPVPPSLSGAGPDPVWEVPLGGFW